MATILRETTIHRRRDRLNAIGDGLGLGNAYEATLERIRAQEEEKAKLAMATLMWVCHAERPLRVDELCHALGVEIGSTHFNNDNVPATETLLACCQGLITLDKEASTFRLMHHTLREYLCDHRSLFPHAQSVMAETCLTYLNSDQSKALPVKPQPDLSSMPFLKYCSRHWGTHARRELSDRARSLAMELLYQYENHVTAKSLPEQIWDPYGPFKVNAPPLFTGLHCASFFGIVDIMNDLLRMSDGDVNRGDSAGIAPLAWAARGGQEQSVELLLGLEAIDPNKLDNDGNTPLWWAAANGHRSVAKQLLERGNANPNKPNNKGHTPLFGAAAEGHESVVKLLLDQKDVDPDKPSNEGYTPLYVAAHNGHESVVKLLLDQKDVDPDKPDNKGYTPLSVAAHNGHESVVKLLLDRKDVDPDKPSNKGYTPLSVAALNGHESVVKLLLDQKDVDPDKPSNEGYTPLFVAAQNGHESVVKLLLDRKDVDPDRPDSNGRTPLSWAATKGHQSVVKLFLDREDINASGPDKNGHTPLWYASTRGHEGAANLLRAWKSSP